MSVVVDNPTFVGVHDYGKVACTSLLLQSVAQVVQMMIRQVRHQQCHSDPLYSWEGPSSLHLLPNDRELVEEGQGESTHHLCQPAEVVGFAASLTPVLFGGGHLINHL